MATVVKNFRIKSGLVVEGATGTINGQNILTETGGNAYILNLVGGATLVKSVDAGTFAVDGAGNLTVKASVFDAYGSASSAQSAAISAAASDATTKVAAEAALRVSGDAASVTTAASDATTKVAAEAALRVSGDAASVATAAADATSKANAAQAAAEATAASALSSAISTEVSNRNTAISSAVSTLVDGAPDLLNTLNELAAAINDDANYTTTITTALGTKAPLASPALTGTPTAPTAAAGTNTTQVATTAYAKAAADAAQTAATSAAASDATTKANAAQSAAASDATTKANAAQAAAEATAAAANTAQQNGTTAFTSINYNSVAKQVAATTGNIVTAAATTAISWAAADYRSAKLVVKAKNGSHTQVSDLVVTLDTSNNVAVSEYGITYSNGTELAAVTADYSGSDVRIRVTPANNNTEVVVVGTLIK